MSSSDQATDGSTLVEPSAKKVKYDSNAEAPEGVATVNAATPTTNTPTKATNKGDAEHKSNNNNLNENNNNSSCSRITKPNADGGDAAKNNLHTQQANSNNKRTAGDQGVATDDAADNDDGADEEGEDLDPTIAKCLEDVEAIQNEIENLNEKASEEILKVEQRFNQLRKPHYEKRNELLQGIPNFWISTFINHPHISAMLDEDDEDCLHYLTRLDVEEFEDIKSGYRIKFYFQENPYFSNTELVKELDLRSRGYPSSNSSTQIQFKDTEAASRLKESCMVAREAKLNNSTARNRQQEPRTFFSWFLDNSDALSDDIAEALKDEIWPNPLQYYLIQDESGAVNDDSDEDDDDDDDEDDDDAVVIDEDDEEDDGEGDLGDGGDDDDDDDDEDDSEVLDGSNSESSGHADDASEIQYAE